MNEIVSMVEQKTGLPEDKAQKAVETVVNYLKQRLPSPISSQIDNVIGSGGGIAGKIGEMLK